MQLLGFPDPHPLRISPGPIGSRHGQSPAVPFERRKENERLLHQVSLYTGELALPFVGAPGRLRPLSATPWSPHRGRGGVATVAVTLAVAVIVAVGVAVPRRHDSDYAPRIMTRDPHFDPSCAICGRIRTTTTAPLFENELWHVRTIDPPCAVPGWLVLITRRHVPGPAQFDDREAETFGPTLRHLQRVLLDVTRALRIYTAAMGESSPHFHAHMVPRYPTMPKDAKAWAVFDLQRAAAAHEVAVNEGEVSRVAQEYAAALRADPPPLR
jgi:diadenosine tetraphosphate (Ap4A) HIT family hydrolase